MSSASIVMVKPALLRLEDAAAYVALSAALIKELGRDPESGFPRPVQLTPRRVGYRTDELDAWVTTRGRSECLPPEGSGYGRRGKG